VLVNFLLLYILLDRMDIVLQAIGFVGYNAIVLTLFIVFTYAFLTPFAYEIQVLGPITQGRLTPVIVIALLSLLFAPQKSKQELKILALLVLSISMHPVIGLYLASFTFVIAVYFRINLYKKLILASLIIAVFASHVRTLGESQLMETSRWSNEIRSEVFAQDFCIHYSNFGNIVSGSNSPAILVQVVTYLLIGCLAIYHSSHRNLHSNIYKVIAVFYVYSLAFTIILNLLIVLDTPLGQSALAMMPMRFLDAANILAFPVLIYHLIKIVNFNVLVPILSLLVIGRIINARLLDFMFKENQVHFILMFLLILVFSIANRKNIGNPYLKANLVQTKKYHILVVFVSTFIAFQIINQANSAGSDWKSLNQLGSIHGFEGSKLLTSQEIDFPMSLFSNYQVLDHGELQSLIYVPERLMYADSKLRTYYATNLQEYFEGSSCSLEDNSDTRALWESWDTGDWQRLALVDGFQFVVVPRDWNLQLERAILEDVKLGSRLFINVAIYRVN